MGKTEETVVEARGVLKTNSQTVQSPEEARRHARMHVCTHAPRTYAYAHTPGTASGFHYSRMHLRQLILREAEVRHYPCFKFVVQT